MRHAPALKASTAAQPLDYLDFIRAKIITLQRRGGAAELNPDYFRDGVSLLREQDAGRATGDLFSLLTDIGKAA